MDYPSQSMVQSVFQELKHLKSEPLSLIYSYPNLMPASGNIYNHSTIFDSCFKHETWKNRPKLESDPEISHSDFYLSEDEMIYLNELFNTDPVLEPLLESNTSSQGSSKDSDETIHQEQSINRKENRKTKSVTRKKTIRSSRFTKSSTLELEEIQNFFDLPITLAAKKMNVGLTVLKKRCRELNIMRWPHRKIKSLKSLICNVKELGMEKEIEMLEEHKMIVEKMPQMELTEKTKKLRQACFKANYKKRRQMQASSSSSSSLYCFSVVK